jgi:protein-disulfide isomerase
VTLGGKTLSIAGISALVGAGATALALGTSTPVAPKERAAIEEIVREYILNHPEILPQAMENLRANEIGKSVEANRAGIETPFAGAWDGAADADVTLVEFFDYACGYCRASLPDIDRLLAEDKKLKIVYREMPVLGQGSVDAARISFAAAKQGKYKAFHKAMFATGRPDAASIKQAIKLAGIDEGAARKFAASSDAEQGLAQSSEIQRGLQLSGTPAWVVGNKVMMGAVGYDSLKEAIAAARALKKK